MEKYVHTLKTVINLMRNILNLYTVCTVLLQL